MPCCRPPPSSGSWNPRSSRSSSPTPYGGDGRPVAVAVEPRQILTILHSDAGANTLFTLRLGEEENGKRTVMIREVQRDPVAGKLIHADFVRIDMSHEITVKVPVHLSGVPVGVKAEGGVLGFV